MHIDKFLAILSGDSLYFPNIYSFDDKFEGTLSEKSLDEIRNISLLDEKNTPLYDGKAFYKRRDELRKLPLEQEGEVARKLSLDQEKRESERIFTQLLKNFISHLIYCNSWFQRGKESHSMWAEYGDKSPTSIAIQTTVGDLIESLGSAEYNIHIGKVKYKDYKKEHLEGYENLTSKDLTNPYNVLKLFYAPFLHKRDLYQDEHEVRAIISFEDVCEKFLGRVYTSEIPFYSDEMFRTDASVLRDYKNPIKNADNGIPIDISLHTLVKKIVVSPTVNDYFNIPFEDLIKRYDIDPSIISRSQIVDIQEDS